MPEAHDSLGPVAIDDLRLVKRAQAGDLAAFEALYRAHAGLVHGLACRLTLDLRFAEDLTQEVFIKVWQQLGTYRAESRFTTWLYRVATNVVLDAMKKRQLLVLAKENKDVPDATSTPAEQRDIERQLQRLPERARMVLLLHDLAGLTHEEIGEQLAISPGTSKAQLFRARRLYRELDDE